MPIRSIGTSWGVALLATFAATLLGDDLKKPDRTLLTQKARPATKHNNATATSEWATWLGPDGTGISREQGLISTFPDDGPKILWRAKLGTGYSGIAVSRGRAFTLFGHEGREYAVCFDDAEGERIWRVDLDADFEEGRSPGPRSMPTVDGDRVYVLGASGQLQCLAVATGKTIWKLNVVEKLGVRKHEEGFSPTPLIDGKQLIVSLGKSVFSLDKMSGESRWKALEEPMNHATPIIREIDGQRQLIVLTGSNLVGLSPANGKEIWRYPQQGVNIATPVVGLEGKIFAGAAYGFGGQLIQVKGGKAEQVYKHSVLAPHTATPILLDGYLYGFDDRNGIFKCVEFATGKEVWNTRGTVKGNLIVADGRMVLINEEGELILAPATPAGFKPTARARIFRGGLCYTAPSLANGRLYVRSDQELVCVQMRP